MKQNIRAKRLNLLYKLNTLLNGIKDNRLIDKVTLQVNDKKVLKKETMSKGRAKSDLKRVKRDSSTVL